MRFCNKTDIFGQELPIKDAVFYGPNDHVKEITQKT